MEQIFILGTNRKMKGRADQAAHYFIGVLGLFAGSLTLMAHDPGILRLSCGAALIIIGALNLLIGFRAFAKNSRFAPKVALRSNEIEIKPTLMSGNAIIPFDDIASISIEHSTLVVTLRNSSKNLRYRASGAYPSELREVLANLASKGKFELK